MYIVKGLTLYRFLLLGWLLFLGFNLCSRFVLLLLLSRDGWSTESWLVLLYGIRMDTIVFSAFALLFALLYALNWRFLLSISLTLFVSLAVFLEVSTFFFFEQFSSRPNYLLIEHAKNIQEIVGMIWGLYPLAITWITPLLMLLVVQVFRAVQRLKIQGSSLKRWQIFPLLVVLLFLGMRSSIDVATPNQSFYTFSQDNIKNELANNTMFSILYAWHWAANERFADYGFLSDDEVFQRIRKQVGLTSDNDLWRMQSSVFSGKKNVILVMLESFGHDHVGYLGGTPTTPNLDRLASKGLAFTQMYATGNRTAWGVSSILTGLYPLPGREYVKALKSQQGFYTIAQSFRQHGYVNTFLYSGDADFDNMRAFMLSNGYDKVLGKESFDASLEKFTWGYADEALYQRAIALIETQTTPFFLTLLSLSSHEPFDYPSGKTPLYEGAPSQSFANSIKYADFALGQFYQNLKDKGLLENTVVAFIADHANRAYGSEDVPIDRYPIAAVIMDKSFQKGQSYNKISSQIDFGPSLLDVAGLDVDLPSIGASVFQHERNSALLMHQKNYAYLRHDGFTIYKGEHQPRAYTYDGQLAALSPEDTADGLAYVLAPHMLYESGRYTIVNHE